MRENGASVRRGRARAGADEKADAENAIDVD